MSGHLHNLENSHQPASLLVENLELLPGGKALDLACGKGRNSLYLAEQGWEVEAVDISQDALGELEARAKEAGLRISAYPCDLTRERPQGGEYHLIVVFKYLQRDLMSWIKEALAPGGVLVYETFTVEQPQFGKPTHPDHLLNRGELLDTFRDLTVLYYAEGIREGIEASASLIAQKPL